MSLFGSNSTEGEAPTTGKVNQDAPPSLPTLNDFCLEHIFSYIPLLERFKLEKVCKQWDSVVRSMWQRVKQLDLPNGVPVEFSKDDRKLPLLKQIFNRVPLTSINIQGDMIRGSNGLIETIVRKCPQLEELHLFSVRVDGAKLYMLAHLKNLKVLYLCDCEPIKDNALKFALKDNRTLTHLELSISNGLRGQFFKFLHAPLETLRLYCHPKLNPFCLEDGLKNFGSTLKNLSVSRCEFVSPYNFEDFLKYTPNLQSLTVASYGIFWGNERYLMCVKTLKNLESLDVSFNNIITDEFYRFLVAECQQLKSLNVSGTECEDSFRFEQMYHISCLNGLPNLRSLNLSDLHYVTPAEIRRYVEKCPPIEYLYLAGHPYIKDEDVKIILTSCQALKHLDLSDCDNITEKTIKTANEVLESRIDDQPLHLVIGNTKIKKPGDSENTAGAETKVPNHPLLTVSYENTFLMHRRQHFIGQNKYSFDLERDEDDSDFSDGNDGLMPLDYATMLGSCIDKSNGLKEEEEDDWSESSWTGTESEDEFFK